MNNLPFLPHVIVCLFLACAVITDLRNFTIPHWISGSIILLLPVGWLLGTPGPSLMSSGLAFGIMTIVVGAIWLSGQFFGGGDWKLLSALAPWVGLEHCIDLVLLISILGGVETFAVLGLRAISPKVGLDKVEFLQPVLEHAGIPYGIAIAFGGAITIIAAWW